MNYLSQKLVIFPLTKAKKLTPKLGSKRKYKLHFKNIKRYLNLELQFKKIHRKL